MVIIYKKVILKRASKTFIAKAIKYTGYIRKILISGSGRQLKRSESLFQWIQMELYLAKFRWYEILIIKIKV